MPAIVTFLITLIIVILLLGLLRYVLSVFPLPPPLGAYVDVVLVIIGVLIIIYLLLGVVGMVPAFEWGHYR
jgi:hypothetical protein